MDYNNLRTNQEDLSMDTSDWRSQLQPGTRQEILNRILETLRGNLPISGPEGLQEIWKISVRFEEIYAAAASQTDYLQKISQKMLTMETKSQTPGGPGSLLSIPAVGNQNLPDPGQQQQLEQLQQQLEQQQQRLLAQALENNLSNTQQQLGSQGNVSELHQQHHYQHQLLGAQSGISNIHPNQHTLHMLHAKVAVQQQQAQQTLSTLLPTQGQQSQSLFYQQQMMSQLQSQPGQLQQQLHYNKICGKGFKVQQQ